MGNVGMDFGPLVIFIILLVAPIAIIVKQKNRLDRLEAILVTIGIYALMLLISAISNLDPGLPSSAKMVLVISIPMTAIITICIIAITLIELKKAELKSKSNH